MVVLTIAHLERKYALLFIRGYDLFQDGTSFRFPKTASFEEHIKSKDKYASIFSFQIKAIVFVIMQIFCKALEKLFNKHGLLPGIFTFQCLLVRFLEQTCLFFCKNYEFLSHLASNLNEELSY